MDGGSTNDASSRGGEGEDDMLEDEEDEANISMSNGSRMSSEKKKSRITGSQNIH